MHEETWLEDESKQMCFWSIGWSILRFHGERKGIEVGQKSMKAIDEAVPPTNKSQLRSLIGKINFIRRFISNLSENMLFPPLLKLKADQELKWDDVQQKAFDEIKEYRKAPPVLVPPQLGKPFKLYVSADNHTIVSALMQEYEGKERVIFYLSRRLLDLETRYYPIEKLCLCLYWYL